MQDEGNYFEYEVALDKNFWSQVSDYSINNLDLVFLKDEDLKFLSSIGMMW